MQKWIFLLMLGIGKCGYAQDETLGERFRKVTADHMWELSDSVRLKFNAHHTQGMVKVGEDFYMTSVEVFRWPQRYSSKQGKYDRDTGEGRGHLLRFNGKGELLEDILLGEGAVYHPGGLDFDGRYLWVPVCEYRPFGKSFVYRVELNTKKVEKVFEVDDALGALAYDKSSRSLVGANWGSRGFYKWRVGVDGQVANSRTRRIDNPSFYIDYQHCFDAGKGMLLCSGLRSYPKDSFGASYQLGGLDLISAEDLRPVHQLPITLRSAAGRIMTNNPSWLELTEKGLRAYFVPDDDLNAVLYVYEVKIHP